MDSLTLEQKSIVYSNSKIILALCGAGTGKTHTFIERIRRLIADGVDPLSIVAITFTNSAARELLARLGTESWDAKLGFTGTLHAFMTRVIRMFSPVTFSVIDEEQSAEVLQEVVKEMKYKGTKKELETVIKLGPPMTRIQFPTAAQNTASAFFNRLRRENLFTFDMLLTEGLRVIQTMPQDRWPFKFLFVDEYQDAGRLDELIYESMSVTNRFFIGDPSQSIYGFRGGRMENILKLARREDVEVHRLTENFRSDAAICEAAETLMCNTEIPPVIRSQSGKRGQIEVKVYDSPGRELSETCNLAESAFRAGEEVAILVRNNDLVDEWVAALKSRCLPVLERKEGRPKDWRQAMDCLTLLCNPNNDWAAYRVLCRTHGRQKADEIRMECMHKFITINQMMEKYPTDMSSAVAFTTLKGMVISSESMVLIERANHDLLAESSAADLALACMRLDMGMDVGKGICTKTIHSAKGLEFDTVLLPAFEDEIIPGTRDDCNVDEERRLAYVGITRARHRLLISRSSLRKNKWPKPGEPEMSPRHTSRFIGQSGLTCNCEQLVNP